MTEQIITKNFYSIISEGGDTGTSYAYQVISYLMKTDLNRGAYISNYSNFDIFSTLKGANTDKILNYYSLVPVHYPKSLLEITESEIYSTPYDASFTKTSELVSKITDNSTNLTTGLRFITTHTNTSESNEIVNGIILIGKPTNSTTCNLVLTKFDADITLAPAESYQFTLDLPNLFQSFPATLGS